MDLVGLLSHIYIKMLFTVFLIVKLMKINIVPMQ